MPLMPTPSPEDEEAGSAWLLATEAARHLRDPSRRGNREVVLNNAFRALQAHDVTGEGLGFTGFHPTTHKAFEAAFEQSYPGMMRDRARVILCQRLREVAYPSEGVEARPDEQAAAFFERVAAELA